MQSQTLKSPTETAIRKGDRDAQQKASLEFYTQRCEVLLDLIENIGKVARAGEQVNLVDRWGDTTALILKP